MSCFAGKFDGAFREARRRVSPAPNRKKANGKARSQAAAESEFVAPDAMGSISRNDFHAYMPTHTYIFEPTGELWPASSVNSRLPTSEGRIRTSRWLDQNRPVEQMTWAPGEPKIIEGRLISDGGWITRPQSRCFNTYRPPTLARGDARKADPWLDHIHKIYGDQTAHIQRFLAHRVQRPDEKINHALVLGGPQGIGKDTLLEPVKTAVGHCNFADVSPRHVLGRFNGFAKSVILRINEARDLGDVDRFAFYDHMKVYIAAPPDVIRVDEKNVREYSIRNVCAVIITTNHKADGIFLPADDRRHYVAWSNLIEKDFCDDYWSSLWGWYENGGIGHVAAYLYELELSEFDPKAPPPKTAAWWDIVAASRAPEDAELADALDRAGNPAVTTLAEIISNATPEFAEFLRDRKSSRKIPHRFEACGYVPFRNSDAKDGLWKIGERRQAVYGRAELSYSQQRIVVQQKYGQ